VSGAVVLISPKIHLKLILGESRVRKMDMNNTDENSLMDMITQIFADRKQYVMEAILAHDDGDLDMGILQGFFDMADSQVAQNMPNLGKGKGKGKAKKGKKGKRPPTGWDLWCSLTRPMITDEITKAKKELGTQGSVFKEGVTVFSLVSKMLGASWKNEAIKSKINVWAGALNAEAYVFDDDEGLAHVWEIIESKEKMLPKTIKKFLKSLESDDDDDSLGALEQVWNENVHGEDCAMFHRLVGLVGEQTDWVAAFTTALKTRWGKKVEVVKKGKKGKKNSDGKKKKRPPNVYQLFGVAYRLQMREENEDDADYKEAIKFAKIGKAWTALNENADDGDESAIDQRAALQEKAQQLKAQAAEEEPEIVEADSTSDESDDLGDVRTPKKKKKAKKIPDAPKKKAKKGKVKKEKAKSKSPKRVTKKSREEILDDWGDLTDYEWDRYEHENDGTPKFWELTRDGKKTLARSGKVESKGKGSLHERVHDSVAVAKKWMLNQIKGKTTKGYKSVDAMDVEEEDCNLDAMLQSSDDSGDD
jgi:predicted DNA-binding WGR domain protein/uncharacterized protein YfkK (UPF0435 family)